MLIVQLREQFFLFCQLCLCLKTIMIAAALSCTFIVFKNQLITKENNNLIDFLKDFSYVLPFTISASSIFQGCLEEIDQTDQDQEPQLVELLDLFRYKVNILVLEIQSFT